MPSLASYARASRQGDSTTRQLCDLLDTLISVRIDLGHDANGVSASPAMTPEQMRAVRLMVDEAISIVRRTMIDEQLGGSLWG